MSLTADTHSRRTNATPFRGIKISKAGVSGGREVLLSYEISFAVRRLYPVGSRSARSAAGTPLKLEPRCRFGAVELLDG